MGLGAHVSSAHIADSRIATAAGNSSSLQPSWSSLQVTQLRGQQDHQFVIITGLGHGRPFAQVA